MENCDKCGAKIIICKNCNKSRALPYFHSKGRPPVEFCSRECFHRYKYPIMSREKFFGNSIKVGGCLDWQGTAPYFVHEVNKKRKYVRIARYAWELYKGAPPSGKIKQVCKNLFCIAEGHLKEIKNA